MPLTLVDRFHPELRRLRQAVHMANACQQRANWRMGTDYVDCNQHPGLPGHPGCPRGTSRCCFRLLGRQALFRRKIAVRALLWREEPAFPPQPVPRGGPGAPGGD